MKKVKIGMRIILGLIYFVFGLNFFLKFIPMPPPTNDALGAYSMALMATGYMFQFIKITEIVCGALLLLNLYVPLALIIIAPVTLNIFMLHLMLAPSGLPMAVALMVLNIGLGIFHIQNYKGVLQR